MAGSKDRLLWPDLPGRVRRLIGRLAGGPVVAAVSCEGGYSPGLAARLQLADRRRVFVKAIDTALWPSQARTYRDEARVSAALQALPLAPRYLGGHDDGRWVILLFECIGGAEPARPWRPAELGRAVAAASELARVPAPAGLPRDHGRLGGWAAVAADRPLVAGLADCAPWPGPGSFRPWP
jgi:hypothetical protein